MDDSDEEQSFHSASEGGPNEDSLDSGDIGDSSSQVSPSPPAKRQHVSEAKRSKKEPVDIETSSEEEEEVEEGEEKRKKPELDMDNWDVDDWDFAENEGINAEHMMTPGEEWGPEFPHIQTSQRKNDTNKWFDDQMKRPSNTSSGNQEEKVSLAYDRPQSLWQWGGLKGIVSAVGGGFSQVLESVETGLGAPTPEDLAKLSLAERRALNEKAEQVKESWPSSDHDDCDSAATDEAFSDGGSDMGSQRAESSDCQSDTNSRQGRAENESSQRTPFAPHFGPTAGIAGLFSGMGKSLVSGSLDVLETLGKKTYETLTVTDHQQNSGQNKAGRRRLIFEQERPNLSLTLRELKAKADEEMEMDKFYEKSFNNEIRTPNYANFFEKFEGLVHLEGLEMLSSNCSRQVEMALIDGISPALLDTLDAVRDAYEDLDDTNDEHNEQNSCSDFERRVRMCLQEIGVALNPVNLIATNKRLVDLLNVRQMEQLTTEAVDAKELHAKSVECLAEFTARCIEMMHKLGQLILVGVTPQQPCSFIQLTRAFCQQISLISGRFSDLLNAAAEDEESPHGNINSLLTSLFLEANNSSEYVKEALRLMRPILETAILNERSTAKVSID